jgi:hypothetical protein
MAQATPPDAIDAGAETNRPRHPNRPRPAKGPRTFRRNRHGPNRTRRRRVLTRAAAGAGGEGCAADPREMTHFSRAIVQSQNWWAGKTCAVRICAANVQRINLYEEAQAPPPNALC